MLSPRMSLDENAFRMVTVGSQSSIALDAIALGGGYVAYLRQIVGPSGSNGHIGLGVWTKSH